MKLINKLLGTILGLALVVTQAKAEETPVIVLTKRNTLVLRDVIENSTITKVQEEALKLSVNSSRNTKLYLFMNTPGGDIEAGNTLISTLKGLPQHIDTITSFAASMGFITVQSLGTRYIIPNGTLMSHRARGSAQGQIPGELNTRVKFFTDALDRQDAKIAKRIGMSKEDYQKLVLNEYWVDGEQAVKEKMADKVVNVRCDKELSEGKTTESVQTMFGPVQVTYSDCPLISYPLAINFSGLLTNKNSCDSSRVEELKQAILKLVYDKKGFYNDYILTNKFKEFML